MADLDALGGTVSLVQFSPGSSVFMVACISPEIVPESSKLVIYDAADKNCSEMGEVYNPFRVRTQSRIAERSFI